jgi:predicted anti-sigma-YlaC factor YlaD
MTDRCSPDYQRAIAYPRVNSAPTYPDALPPDDLPIRSRHVPLYARVISNVATFVVCVAYLGFLVWVGINHGGNGSGSDGGTGDMADAAAVILAGALALIVCLVIGLCVAALFPRSAK